MKGFVTRRGLLPLIMQSELLLIYIVVQARYLNEISSSKLPVEKLPAVSYSLFNDKQLKLKLRELGLHTTGDRTMLIKRHEKYVVTQHLITNFVSKKSISAKQIYNSFQCQSGSIACVAKITSSSAS